MSELVALLESRHGLRIDELTRARLERALAEGSASPEAIVRDPGLMQELVDQITLQETSFFRDPALWDDLAAHLLPGAGRPVVVWSAGCANGQEPWTLAMLLTELGVERFEVVASDVSAAAIARASAGSYDERELRGLSPARRRRFMTCAGSTWTVRPELRERVRFARHNAATQPAPVPDGTCALVLCRYVLIYLTADAADALLESVARALTPEGHLVIGAAESLWHLTERFAREPLPHAVAYRCRRADDAPGPREVQRTARAALAETRPDARALRRAAPEAAAREAAARADVPTPSGPVAAGRAAVPEGAATPDAPALVRTGEAAAARGDLPAAVAAFRGAAFLDPENALALTQLGLVLEATDDAGATRAFRSARAALERRGDGELAAELGPYAASALVRLLAEKLEP